MKGTESHSTKPHEQVAIKTKAKGKKLAKWSLNWSMGAVVVIVTLIIIVLVLIIRA